MSIFEVVDLLKGVNFSPNFYHQLQNPKMKEKVLLKMPVEIDSLSEENSVKRKFHLVLECLDEGQDDIPEIKLDWEINFVIEVLNIVEGFKKLQFFSSQSSASESILFIGR